jgi:hypothetical protein
MLAESAVRRVYEFHEFLEQWLSGVMPYDVAAVHAQIGNFDPEFQCLPPTGRVQTRDALLNWLLEAFGSQPGLSITIEKVNVRRTQEDMVLLTYEEHQLRPKGSNRRLSSAVFVAEPGGTTSSRWFHLHEAILEVLVGSAHRATSRLVLR